MNTPNYTPGVCIACSAEAPVLLIPGYGEGELGLEGHRCCKACVDELDALMSQASGYEPHIYAPWREW